MFDFGFGELVMVAIVALLVLGPERLPGAARTAGALLRRIRQGWGNVREEVEREFQAEELKRRVNEAVQQGRDATEGLGAEAKKHVDEITGKLKREANAKSEPEGASDDKSADE